MSSAVAIANNNISTLSVVRARFTDSPLHLPVSPQTGYVRFKHVVGEPQSAHSASRSYSVNRLRQINSMLETLIGQEPVISPINLYKSNAQNADKHSLGNLVNFLA